jgi:2'-5' RNA ligase
MKRLFIGVPVAPAVGQSLAAAAETLARRARGAGLTPRWVAPANYHVTLAFLGATRPEAVGAVRARLSEVAASGQRFRFRAARLGGFPSLAAADVLWAGVEDPSGELARLADAVAVAMADLGFRRDPRPYHPHVTVARLRPPSDLSEVALPVSEQVFGETRCDTLVLFDSVTNSNGSAYRVEALAPLGTPKTAPERQSEPVQTAPLDASHGSDDGWDRTP